MIDLGTDIFFRPELNNRIQISTCTTKTQNYMHKS